MGCTEDLDDTGQRRVGASSHVHGFGGQPDRVDTDHLSQSRSQAAHSPAPCSGQLTVTVDAPRRISRWMTVDCGAACGGNCTAMNSAPKAPTHHRKAASVCINACILAQSAVDHVGIEPAAQRYRGHRGTWLSARLNNFCPELFAVLATRQSRRFQSVHLFVSWTLCLPLTRRIQDDFASCLPSPGLCTMCNLAERDQQGLFHFYGYFVKRIILRKGIFLPEHPDLFVQFVD